MKKLTALILSTALITTACSIKHTEGFMDKQTIHEKVAVVKKNNPEQKVDKEAMQEELSGIASLKKFGTQMAIGAIAGSNSQAINMALSIASNYALDKTMYKDTYTVITDYDNPKLIADDCSFNVKLLFKDEKTKDEWSWSWGKANMDSFLARHYLMAGLKPNKNRNNGNKITFYILDMKNPNWYSSLPFMTKYSFIESVIEVETKNQLAGRYIIFGTIKESMFSDLFSKIKKHCGVENSKLREAKR